MERDFLSVIQSEIPENGVLISVGLRGSWMSPVTEEIARVKGFQVLRTDTIRLEVLKGQDIFDNQVASSRDNRLKVYDEMFRRAEAFLKREKGGLILDATFVTQDLRVRAAQLAEAGKRPLVIAECVCTEERSIARILKRTQESYESNALTREAYLNNKAIFQPVDIDALKKSCGTISILHLTIDTEHDTPPGWKIKTIEKR